LISPGPKGIRADDSQASYHKIDVSPFSLGYPMKNQVYTGPQFERVMAAWLNLEAGL
jgi:hypothetical protein